MNEDEFVAGFFEGSKSIFSPVPRTEVERNLRDIYKGERGEVTEERARGIYYSYSLGIISGTFSGSMRAFASMRRPATEIPFSDE